MLNSNENTEFENPIIETNYSLQIRYRNYMKKNRDILVFDLGNKVSIYNHYISEKTNIEHWMAKDFLNNHLTKITNAYKQFDVRIIEGLNLIDIPNTFNYDRNFNKCIETSSYKELKPERWIELDLLKNQLSFLKSESLLGFLLIRAPIIIDKRDGDILLNEFNKNT